MEATFRTVNITVYALATKGICSTPRKINAKKRAQLGAKITMGGTFVTTKHPMIVFVIPAIFLTQKTANA